MAEAAGKDTGERDGVIREIFSLSKGTVFYTDYSCALHSKLFYGGGVMHGRMYITDAHLCFYSNLFGFEKKIVIPYDQIQDIAKKNSLKMLPNAIRVTTFETSYFFTSFWGRYRDECYLLTRRLYSKHQGLAAQETGGGEGGKRGALLHKASTADSITDQGNDDDDDTLGDEIPTPTELAMAHKEEDASAFGDTAIHFEAINVRSGSTSSSSSGVGAGISAATTPSLSPEKTKSLRKSNSDHDADSAGAGTGADIGTDAGDAGDSNTIHKRISRSGCSGTGEGGAGDGAGDNGAGANATTSDGDASTAAADDDAAAADSGVGGGEGNGGGEEGSGGSRRQSTVSAEVQRAMAAPGGKENYQELVTLELPCTVSEVYRHFVADGAGFSESNHHVAEGHTEVAVEPWSSGREGLGEFRSVVFRAPVNAPIGPKSSIGNKIQRLQLTKNGEEVTNLQLDSSTRMADIPFGDYFSIEDRMLVHPKGDSEGCVVAFSLEVRFSKSTMWKSAIIAQTKRETKDSKVSWHKQSMAHLEAQKKDTSKDAKRGGGTKDGAGSAKKARKRGSRVEGATRKAGSMGVAVATDVASAGGGGWGQAIGFGQQPLLLVWVLLLLLFYSQYSLQLLVEQNTKLQTQMLEIQQGHIDAMRQQQQQHHPIFEQEQRSAKARSQKKTERHKEEVPKQEKPAAEL